MSLENFVICDDCGKKVAPPQNAGWQVEFEIAADGVNVAGVDGHLCFDCRMEFKRWRDARRKQTLVGQRPS